MALLTICLLVGLATMTAQSYRHVRELHSELSEPTFQAWQTVGNFGSPRMYHASALINNKIYIFGGDFYNSSASFFFSDVQFLSLDVDDGTIIPGSLTFTQSFSTGRSGLAAAYHNNYVYLAGGFTGADILDDVQFGQVEENGQILSWETSPSHLNAGRSNHRLEIVQTPSGDTYLAAIGGMQYTSGEIIPLDDIEVAEIYPNASIGPWNTCSYHIKGGRLLLATNVVNNTLYVIGGAGTTLLDEVFTDVQFASIRPDGCPDSWSTSAHSVNMPLYGHTSLTINSNMFIVLGGNAGVGNLFNNVQYSSLHTDDVDTKQWIFDQNQFSTPRYGHSSVQLNNKFIYVIGGRNKQDDLNDIQMSSIDFESVNIDEIEEYILNMNQSMNSTNNE